MIWVCRLLACMVVWCVVVVVYVVVYGVVVHGVVSGDAHGVVYVVVGVDVVVVDGVGYDVGAYGARVAHCVVVYDVGYDVDDCMMASCMVVLRMLRMFVVVDGVVVACVVVYVCWCCGVVCCV